MKSGIKKSGQCPDQDTDTEAEIEIETEADPPLPPKGKSVSRETSKILDPEKFDLFWLAYPRKINKGGAVKKWNATIKAEETDPDQLILASENYGRSCAGKDEKFIMHAATFLGPDRRWKDWLDTAPPVTDNRGGTGYDDYL